ncbi:MAG: DUF839 domain-containing protein, partial [Bdellovibrionales bacterium]|nr:DUF839 domain-containing protein [Bdellovibrionales bacterium]
MESTRKYLNRRTFIKQSLTVAATHSAVFAAITQIGCKPIDVPPGMVGIESVKVPKGMSVKDFSKEGEILSNGGKVPSSHDGMACFDGSPLGVAYVLIRNHEVSGFYSGSSNPYPGLSYDERTRGGTTTILLDENYNVVDQYMSLAGTLRNCSGGKTPWNTWISCEEAVEDATSGHLAHGFAFEVDPYAGELKQGIALKAMGKFRREGIAVPVQSGIVYQTEDEDDGCVYRFIPDQYGNLTSGRLEVLKLTNPNDKVTPDGVAAEWVELDPNDLPLRSQAKKLGALQMKAPEGIMAIGEDIVFTASKDGYKGLGFILKYSPSTLNSGQLSLVFESTSKTKISQPDQMTYNSFGDIIVCEDVIFGSRIVGIRPDGKVYLIATNSYREWTGVCYSPDEKTLFANAQGGGFSVAITG